jgi:C4-dicarboxylate transporter, DcuC family
MKGISRVSTFLLVVIGTIISFYSKTDLNTYFSAYAANASLITLFILVPLLSIPIRLGGYLESIYFLYIRYLSNKNQLYFISTTLTYILSIILNIGAVFIVYNLINVNKHPSLKPTVVRALLRGYPLCIYWSPYFVSVGLITSYFNVSWGQIFIVGLLLSVVNLFIGYSLEKERNNLDENTNIEIQSVDNGVQQEKQKSVKKVRELLLIGTMITIAILVLERLTPYNVISLVSLSALTVFILWTTYLRKVKRLGEELKKYISLELPQMKNEMALFISAGFFGHVIFLSGVSDQIIWFFQSTQLDQALQLSLFLFVAVIILSIIGIHPFVSVTTLSISLSSTEIIAGSEWFYALVLLSAWPITTAISPFSGLVLLMSSITSQSPIHVGIIQNWRYALYVSISSLFILNLLHYFCNL